VTGVKLGVALPLEAPVGELLALAERVERLGYDALWANDDRLQHDVFSVLAAMAERTEAIGLGPGVTNPYSRHPALIATAIATLDELSGGRARIGLGAGGTNHRALGIRREAPAAALREALTVIRGLLGGERVTVDGRVVRAQDARLDFTPRRADVPLYIGARGPRVLEVAGELADGVIVGNLATPAGWDYALGRVRAGAARAGREPTDVRLCAWLYTCVADDPAVASAAIAPMVATSLATSRPILSELGVEMPAAFAESMERRGWSLDAETTAEAARTLPVDVIDTFGLAGTPEECRRRLGALLDAHPAICEVTIVPFAPAGGDIAETITRFIDEVARQPVGHGTGGKG